MKVMTRLLTALLLLTLATGAHAESASAELDAIADEVWTHLLDTQTLLRVQEGLPVTTLVDLSYERSERDVAWARSVLPRLDAIDDDALDHDRWLTKRVLQWSLGPAAEDLHGSFWHRFQVTPYSWRFSGLQMVFSTFAFTSEADLERYLSLLDQVPGLVQQVQSNLATQRERGILLPVPAIDPSLAVLAPYTAGPDASPFTVVLARLAALETDTAAFHEAVAKRITERIVPAFETLIATFDDDYRRAAPTTVGMSQYPGGAEAYQHLVRFMTTRETTPEELHQTGLRWVETIMGEMAEIRTLLGSDLDHAAFNDWIRKDPRFIACSADEVGERLMTHIRRIEPLVDDYFDVKPEAPYGVARLPEALEASLTFGYYQQPLPGAPTGRYLFNGSKLDQRTQIGAASLIFHELIPGHHFQIALQQENDNLHPVRRKALWYSSFGEGWAEYAAWLGHEMGLYKEPYDRYGRHAADLFLTTRLVVDTGMNALGWSRERALAFMRERLLESETQLATETLRYSTDMPAQALAYKTGMLVMVNLRRQAEEELGPGFDVRRFHDAMIGPGGLPLTVLEEHIRWWIDEEKKRLAKDKPDRRERRRNRDQSGK
ncbi:MAG: DUF885 domain-containing protein [Acidobacteriota bacterium]